MGMNNQHGGTFLGLIIGLTLGIAFALGVALYVTKVPIPFLDKTQSRSPEQDAIERLRNKDWDPNTPLYGKNPARPSRPDVASTGQSTENPVLSKENSSNTLSGPLPENPAVSSAVTITPVAESTTAGSTGSKEVLATAQVKSPNPEIFVYVVQVGAFRTSEDAQSQRAKLSLWGIEAKVSERDVNGSVLYRVRIGPFEEIKEAEKIKQRLMAGGLDTVMVRIKN